MYQIQAEYIHARSNSSDKEVLPGSYRTPEDGYAKLVELAEEYSSPKRHNPAKYIEYSKNKAVVSFSHNKNKIIYTLYLIPIGPL